MTTHASAPNAGSWRGWVGGVIAFMLGFVVSVFTAGPALFSDGSFAERPPVLAVSMVAFGVLGAVMGMLAPRHWKAVAVGLTLAAFPVAWFFGRDAFGDPKMAALAVGFAIGDAAVGAAGALLGWHMRRGKR